MFIINTSNNQRLANAGENDSFFFSVMKDLKKTLLCEVELSCLSFYSNSNKEWSV